MDARRPGPCEAGAKKGPGSRQPALTTHERSDAPGPSAKNEISLARIFAMRANAGRAIGDEDPALHPMPVEAWLREKCEAAWPDRCRRTADAELLGAARAVRDGRAVNSDGQCFRVAVTPGRPNYAATFLANFIAWRSGGNVAVLTPSRRGGFADNIVERVRAGPLGQRRNDPFPTKQESGEAAEGDALGQRPAMPANCSAADALAHVQPHGHVPAVKSAREWIGRRRRVLGTEEVTAEEVRRQVDRAMPARRRYGGRLSCLRAVSSQGIRSSIFSTKTVNHDPMVSLNNFQLRLSSAGATAARLTPPIR
jgi:hypothetical protein